MKTNKIRGVVLPLIAAFIWGTAFVAQSVGAEIVEPFTFNACRSVIAFFVLLAASFIFAKFKPKREKSPEQKRFERKNLILGGICCGAFLSCASCLQQAGLAVTSAGQAGFITALYVVLVPIFGLFLKKKAPLPVWFGVILAVGGLYLLCVSEGFTIERSDFLVFLCAIVFAFQILSIDHFVQYVDGVQLSCAQFFVTSVICTALTFLFENPSMAAIMDCALPLLYVGIFSSGVAYTLQILAQKDSNPTVVTILLSLESVFSVLAGAVILGDKLSAREYTGCVLMFAAVIMAQIHFPSRKKV